jgi:hypothetical protein
MVSPFIPQLGTNYCPTDEEVLQIKTLLVEPILRLEQIDNEIADLQKAIDKLAEERESLGAYVEAHRALISPVRQLPLDIIQEIFLACLPTHRNCVMSASEAPVLLGRICSSWRTISLSTPRFWAALHIAVPSRGPAQSSASELLEKKYAQRLETMKAWLGRSGDCPLSISLESRPDFSPVQESSPSPFLQALIPLAPRWRIIKFTAQAPVLLEALSNLTERDVPILQDIAIFDHPGLLEVVPSPSKSWASVGILRALKLSKLGISSNSLPTEPTELPLRWNQLTALSLQNLGWDSSIALTSDRAVQILSQCHELRTCQLAVVDFDDGHVESRAVGAIIECPLLHKMYLVCGGTPAITLHRMFGRLRFPELRAFGLRGFSGPESYNRLSFSSFLAISTRLESLALLTDTFSKESLADLLRGLPPTMQRLEITDANASQPRWARPDAQDPLDDDLLGLLTPSHDLPTICCPALREFIIPQCDTVSDATLLRFITARMTSESCSPLERVDVLFSRQREFDIFPSIQQFIDAGLRVALKYPAPVLTPPDISPWQGLSVGPYDEHSLGWT